MKKVNSEMTRQAMYRAASLYLCDSLPEKADRLPKSYILQFIEDNRWEVLEDVSPEHILDMIQDCAEELIRFRNVNIKEEV